jgi:Bacterial Ig-like domain (group 3)/Beta-propeller repeat
MRRRASAIRGKSLPRRPRLELLEARLLLASGAALTTPDAAALAGIGAAYGQLPMSFEANQGQTASQVGFLSRGSGYSLFLTPDQAVLSLQSPAASGAATQTAGDVLQMQLVGANAAPVVAGLDQLPGTSNYLIGDDPSQWHTDVPSFAKVAEQDVYPGVDLVYYGNQSQLEYDFDVAPGTDPGVIRLAFQGVKSTTLDTGGDLVLHTAGGDVVEEAPVLYQDIGGTRQAVPGAYIPEADGQVGFAVGAYDRSKPLVIDPILSYSSYLGGSGNDEGLGIAVDAAGDAYLTGYTTSMDFPTTPGAFQPAPADVNTEAFVTKLNPAGTALVYSTYLGGGVLAAGNDVENGSYGSGIAVDAAGDAYITGTTGTTDFPTVDPIQATNRGGNDAFITKLNPTGSALIYSTYLGGRYDDEGAGIAVDAAGDAYVTGFTYSNDFPTENPLQPILGNPPDTFPEAFVAKFNTAGSALVYSTYLGGSGYTRGNGIAVDAAGEAYITGITNSPDFPITPGAFQPASAGELFYAFVTKLDPAGSALVYSTCLGGGTLIRNGSNNVTGSGGTGIAVDAVGDAYITGETSTTDFPTVNPFQAADDGGNDAFVTKLNPAGTALIYSTYLGGSGGDYATGIAVDAAGDAYVTGATATLDYVPGTYNTNNFPTTPNAFQPNFGGGPENAFVTELDAAGSALVYSTFLGGSGADSGTGIAVDAAGDAYLTGTAGSSDFPTVNPFQPNRASPEGYSNAFVSKIAPDQVVNTGTVTTLTPSANPSSFGQPVTFSASVTVQGAGVATGTVTFLEGTVVLGTGILDGDGLATFSTSSLSVGDHTITAAYGGDPSFAASSSSPVDVTIDATALAPTTTTLTASPTTADLGQPVTFTAIVGPQDPSVDPSELAGESVLFQIVGGTSTDAPLQLVDGQVVATLTLSILPAGHYYMIASYGGDSTFAASASSPATVTINDSRPAPMPTTTTITASTTTADLGQPVTFTAIVGPQDPSVDPGLLAGESAQFTIDEGATTVVPLQDVDGQEVATLTTSTLAAGEHFVSASFAGDPAFASSASSSLYVVINAPSPTLAPTMTTLTTSPDADDRGQLITFTAIVSPQDPSLDPSGLAGGMVLFTIDGATGAGVPLQLVDGQEVATLTTSTLAVGPHTVAAAYAATASFAASASNSVDVTVDAPSPTPTPTAPVPLPVVGPSAATDGPLVMNLQRFGYHSQPTVLVLTFNEALDPSTASNPANYAIVPIGPHGKFDHPIVVSRIAYDPTSRTVRLRPSRRLNVHDRFELVVDGTSTHGVVDLALRAMDGGKTGKAGSDYIGQIGWKAIAGPSLPGERYARAWRKLVASGVVGQ